MSVHSAITVMQLSGGQTNAASAAGFIGILRETPSLRHKRKSMDQLFGGTPGRRRQAQLQAQLQVNNLGLPRPTESHRRRLSKIPMGACSHSPLFPPSLSLLSLPIPSPASLTFSPLPSCSLFFPLFFPSPFLLPPLRSRPLKYS